MYAAAKGTVRKISSSTSPDCSRRFCCRYILRYILWGSPAPVWGNHRVNLKEIRMGHNSTWALKPTCRELMMNERVGQHVRTMNEFLWISTYVRNLNASQEGMNWRVNKYGWNGGNRIGRMQLGTEFGKISRHSDLHVGTPPVSNISFRISKESQDFVPSETNQNLSPNNAAAGGSESVIESMQFVCTCRVSFF